MSIFFSLNTIPILNQEVKTPFLEKVGVQLYIKREDVLHPEVSGNKFRKLKYNLQQAKDQGFDKILTFGGAFSNHIAATAAAGKLCDFETIGVIRGEELAKNKAQNFVDNKTLKFAHANGMELDFVSRAAYREKTTVAFQKELQQKYGDFYLIPEGGTNTLAVKGCTEILTSMDAEFDHICCAVGTGGTIAGIINAANVNQKIWGFPALRGGFLSDEIKKYTTRTNWELITEYHFGGYGKINQALIEFVNMFRETTGILLDPLYTGKMIFGIYDRIHKGFFKKNTRILAIHTGGLQGISGINEKLKKKRLPLIAVDI